MVAFSVIVGLFVFAIGASIGSFLNVVVYRLPAGLSLVQPPSRCPACLTRLKPYENVPVFGWLWLRGRCRYCKTSISVRYPLVEAATGALFLLTFWAFSWSGQTLGYWVFFSWLLALSLIDLDTLTLPHQLTQPGLVAGLGYQVLMGVLPQLDPTALAGNLISGILGAVIGIWLFDLINLVGTIALNQQAMGGGDAKLVAMIGAWLGWKLMLIGGLLACFIGAIVGTSAIALGILDRRQPMPFGPFLALGAVLAAFSGEAIITRYLEWMGLS